LATDTRILTLDSKVSAKIDSAISDTIVKALAHVDRKRWMDALQQQYALEQGTILSYSIAGRTVTNRNANEGTALVNELEAKVYTRIYGSVTLADANTNVLEP